MARNSIATRAPAPAPTLQGHGSTTWLNQRGLSVMRRALAFSIVLKAALSASGASAETLKVAVAQRGFWNSSFIEFDIDILYTEGGASTLTPVIAGSIDIAMTNGTLGARPRMREPRDSSRNSCF